MSAPRVVLTVPHQGKDKMVGKVFHTPTHGQVFMHQEVKKSQEHFNFRSPGGLDNVVLEWLETHGVNEVHHLSGKLLTASVESFRKHAIRRTYDERDRWFLPEVQWKEVPLDYEIPWVSAILNLGVAKQPAPSS